MKNYEEEELEIEEEYENEEDNMDEKEYLDHNFKKDSTLDIQKTYNYFLKYAKTIQVMAIIFIVIIMIGSLVLAEETDGISFFMGIIVSIILYGISVFQAATFKWKAYMLKCVFEIKEQKKDWQA